MVWSKRSLRLSVTNGLLATDLGIGLGLVTYIYTGIVNCATRWTLHSVCLQFIIHVANSCAAICSLSFTPNHLHSLFEPNIRWNRKSRSAWSLALPLKSNRWVAENAISQPSWRYSCSIWGQVSQYHALLFEYGVTVCMAWLKYPFFFVFLSTTAMCPRIGMVNCAIGAHLLGAQFP